MQDLPNDVMRRIQDYLTYKERIKFPIIQQCWIETIEFPLRYPIMSYDIRSFGLWVLRREQVLSQSVKTLIIHNHIEFFKNEIFLYIFEILSSFLHIESIRLDNFRPIYLIFDSISPRVFLSLYKILRTKLLKYVDVDPPFLLHLNPSLHLTSLQLEFTYASYSSSNFPTYSAKTGTYPLRIFLQRLLYSGGYIRRLQINVVLNDIYKTFDFLFKNPTLYKIIGSIAFQDYVYKKDPIVMMWRENKIDYSVSTGLEFKK